MPLAHAPSNAGCEFVQYRGVSDDSTRAFCDALTTIRGVVRFADGDNRQLRTSHSR